MTVELAEREPGAMMEKVVVKGDLSVLTPTERLHYYNEVCRSLSLNPLTRPFEYIVLNNRLTLYTRKDATDQLRKLHGVSVTNLEQRRVDDIYVVTAYGKDRDGRIDSSVGAVYVKNLVGEALANGIMKAETKAKRRLTLSMCGLGWVDESEVDSIPDAQTVVVDHATGEVKEQPKLTKPAVLPDMVTETGERLWQRWLERVTEARELGVQPPDLRLPIGRALLVSEGIKLNQQIAVRRLETAQAIVTTVDSVNHPLYQELADRIEIAARLGIDTSSYQVSTPGLASEFEAVIDNLEQSILAAEEAGRD